MTSVPGPSAKTGLGVELHGARVGRGITLDDAQRATRISRRYLEALEEEDFAALPAPVFARGFLRSYSQYLGLDPTALIARFPGDARPPQALPDVTRFGGAAVRQPDAPGSPARERYEEAPLTAIPTIDTRSPSVRLGPWLVAAFVVLAVLAGVVAIVTLGDDGGVPGAAPVVTPAGVSPGPASAESDVETVPTEPTIRLETMPDLTLGTISDATVILRRSGLPFVIVEVYDPSAAVGAVIEQVPLADETLDAAAVVTLIVSRGARPVDPPATAPATAPGTTDSAAPETDATPETAPSTDADAPGSTSP